MRHRRADILNTGVRGTSLLNAPGPEAGAWFKDLLTFTIREELRLPQGHVSKHSVSACN